MSRQNEPSPYRIRTGRRRAGWWKFDRSWLLLSATPAPPKQSEVTVNPCHRCRSPERLAVSGSGTPTAFGRSDERDRFPLDRLAIAGQHIGGDTRRFSNSRRALQGRRVVATKTWFAPICPAASCRGKPPVPRRNHDGKFHPSAKPLTPRAKKKAVIYNTHPHDMIRQGSPRSREHAGEGRICRRSGRVHVGAEDTCGCGCALNVAARTRR